MRALKTGTLMVYCVLALMVSGCSDGDPITPEPVVQPSVQLSLTAGSLAIGEQGSLGIRLKEIDDSVFAMSLRIGYDATLVAIDEGSGFSVGDFLGNNAIALFQVDSGVLYLSITDIAGKAKALNSGSVGVIAVQGLSAGQCAFTVALEDFRFIDAAGSDVEILNLKASGVSLSIQ